MARRRAPTPEELSLWEQVTRSIAPLRPLPARPKRVKPSAAPPARPAAPTKPAPVAKPAAAKPPPPKPPPALHPLDRRTRSRVARGSVAIDRRIDLHGLTQAAAHIRLERFLHDAQADGARLVLVITGKGKPGGATASEERGVLRRVVPAWLAAPHLRTVVIGFEPAGPAHGGAGALYVRLRRAGRS